MSIRLLLLSRVLRTVDTSCSMLPSLIQKIDNTLLRVFVLSSLAWLTAATDYPFLELNTPTLLSKGDDGNSAQINIPSGFRLGRVTHYKVFVSTNGYFAFETPRFECCPRFFNSSNHIVAPFWADVDTSIAGDVSYQVFDTSSSPELLEEVSGFIATKQEVPFTGQWMLVADWSGVLSFRGSSTITNSFQGLVVTNGSTSYAVFTYKCGLLEWSGDAVIGFRSEQDHFSIHPLSGTTAQLIACQNISVSNWTNVIYRLDRQREDVEQCEDDDDLNVTRQMTEQYGNCVPYTRIPSRENPCDQLFREGIDYVFVPFRRRSGDVVQLNNFVADANIVVDLISDDCREPARRILCYFYYPPCGNETMFESPKEVCRNTCMFLRDDLCPVEWESATQHFNRIGDFVTRIGLNFIDCNDPGAFIHPLPHCCFDAGLDIMTLSATQPTDTTAPVTVSDVRTTNSQSTALVAGAVGGTVAFIVIVAVIAILLVVIAVKYKWRHAAKPLASFPNPDISVHGLDEPISPNSPSARYFSGSNLLPPIPSFVPTSRAAKVNSGYLRQMSESNLLIPSRQIQLKDCIGKGEFGVVYRAHLIGWEDSTVPELVAVKTLKAVCSLKDVNELMEESLKMKALSHPNILNLIGVSVDVGDSPYIIMPYMANGSLLSYLRKERPHLTIAVGASVDLIIPAQKQLLSICLQVVKGMEYLAEQRFIHRDLAARNCMIDANFVIKVADFGLSEDIYARNYFRQMKEESGIKLPIRWMALESLQDGIFTEKTDVWSFGVTCWEVFSLGKSPYPGVDPFTMVKFLESGQRLEKPSNAACSDEIYAKILQCWNEHADKRPSFSDLVTEISKLLEEIAGYMDFSSISADGPQDQNGYDHLVKNCHGYDHLAESNEFN